MVNDPSEFRRDPGWAIALKQIASVAVLAGQGRRPPTSSRRPRHGVLSSESEGGEED